MSDAASRRPFSVCVARIGHHRCCSWKPARRQRLESEVALNVDALFCLLYFATGARIIGMVNGEYFCEMSGKSNHHLSRDMLVLDHDEKWERFFEEMLAFCR